MNQKYKVGDRVRYQAGERAGNRELDGWLGTVIGTDGSKMPYTVEFDEPYAGAMEDDRFGGKKGHCWHCTEEHLFPAEKSVERGGKKREDAWSSQEIETLKEMKAAGRTAKEIGRALGRTEGAVNFRWGKVRGSEKENKAAEEDSVDEPGETTALNDLESVLAETVTELKTENDRLRGEIADLMQERAEWRRKNTEQAEKLQMLTESHEQIKNELADALGATAYTEEQLDETIRERNVLRKTLQQAQRQLAEKEKAYQADTELLYQRETRIKKLDELLFQKDERIEWLEERLERATGVALGVTERFLLGERM